MWRWRWVSCCASCRKFSSVTTISARRTGRAGFLSAWSWGLGLERCLQVGQVLAVLTLETVGTQEYDVTPLLERMAEAYGEQAAADVRPHVTAAV